VPSFSQAGAGSILQSKFLLESKGKHVGGGVAGAWFSVDALILSLRFVFLLPAVLGLLAPLMSCCDRYRGFDVRLYFLFSLTPVRGGTYFLWR
jgi:hypothetical protein